MATVVHGACNNSPRQQHHQCELTTGATGCIQGSQYQHQLQLQHQHQSSTPVYSSISKYLRPHTATQLHTHPHIYDGNNTNTNSAQLQYGTTLNQISYMPMNSVVSHPSTTMQHGYGSVQLSCATPAVVPSSSAEAYRNYWSHIHAATLTYGSGNGRGNNKRKTAVQLLAETKPFYMKTTETNVNDHLPPIVAAAATPSSPGYRKTFLSSTAGLKRGRNTASASVSLSASGRSYNGSGGSGNGNGNGSGSGNMIELERRFLPRPPNNRDISSSIHNTHTHHHTRHHHHSHHTQMNRHSSPSYGSNIFQTKLKMLLAPENSRDLVPITSTSHGSELSRKFDFNTTTIGGENCSAAETSLPYLRKDEMVAIPPPMFLSTQSYDESYSYTGGDGSSIDDPLVLTDDYRPISPPAEYAAETTHTNFEARGRYNYQRSYSHSHEMSGDNSKFDPDAFNINSHKSLPDLHSQISRHSPHSEILSCCSRGNRSNKSAGESSLNRDSGGSSGHYTHRSEPCYRQRDTDRDNYENVGKNVCCNHTGGNTAAPIEIRRDSGSSTQHSANSYCVGYGIYGRTAAECVACRCSRNTTSYDASCDYLFNFPTPIVPEAFQDDYTPPSPTVLLAQAATQTQPQTQTQSQSQIQTRMKLAEQRYYNSSNVCGGVGVGVGSGSGESRQQQQQQQQQQHAQQQLYSQTAGQNQGHSTIRLPPNPCNIQSPGSTPSMEDISPPPIEFKRQKCIRVKNRNRLPIPNALSMCNNGLVANSNVIGYGHGGHGHGHGHGHCGGIASDAQTFHFPKCISTNSRRSSCERVLIPTVAIAMPAPPPPQPPPSLPLPLPPSSSSSVGTSICPNELDQSYTIYGRDVDEISDLEHFFDRMGLNDEKFNEIYTVSRRRRSRTTDDSDDSSTVFFSDVSTVDSMRLPDSTETQPQTTQPYRPSEPPSIVERNARIIKWLCNIRKLEHN